MPTYNVSVQSQNYNIVSEAKKKFAVGVNYDIPAKYLQNNNEVLDDFTSQFDGTRVEFDLTEGNTAYFPTNCTPLRTCSPQIFRRYNSISIFSFCVKSL